MIEILIPTYNREKDIDKNLRQLIDEITINKLENDIAILVSNNCSTDNTKSSIENIKNSTMIDIKAYHQNENIGLEKNAIFLLEHATTPYIMFLGDDDFLPLGYLNYILKKLKKEKNLKCILPGLSSLYANGDKVDARIENFDEKYYRGSFDTVAKLSHLGHQMSGVLLKRENLLDLYREKPSLQNIYLFIYFVSYNILYGDTIYIPEYKILVSVDNQKDWKYDKSTLVSEVFKNYKILYPHNYLKRNYLNIMFLYKQIWRLGIEMGLKSSLVSFWYILTTKNIEILTKLLLPFLYIYLYIRKLISK